MREFRTRFYTWKIALEGDRYSVAACITAHRAHWYGIRTSLGCRKLSEKVKVRVEQKYDWVQNLLAMQRA